MSAATTMADLRRELEKARITLIAAQTHLAAHAEANAALHCAPTVLYSPLHAQVTAAIGQIEHALQRTEQAYIDADRGELNELEQARLGHILLDLDRCEHGRHSVDDCADCGGKSHGNPHMQPGDVIGYTVHANPITVPAAEDRHLAQSWRPKRGRTAS